MADRATIKSAWFNFINDNTPVETTVVFAEAVSNKQGPRPPKPFITIKFISGPSPKGSFDTLMFKGDPGPPEENNTEYTLSGLRQHTVGLQAFGLGSEDDLALLQTLLDAPDVVSFFKTNGDIAIVNRGTVLDITELIDVGFERRHSLDIIFNTASNVDVAPGSIEKVRVGGKIKDVIGDDKIIVDPVDIPES